MAEIHQRMADCLVTQKPISACRVEMQTSCQEMMGKQGCTMMGTGNGGMGPGMMGGGGMMQQPGAPTPPSAPKP